MVQLCFHHIILVLCQNRAHFKQVSHFAGFFPVLLIYLSIKWRTCKVHKLKNFMIFRRKVIWKIDYYFSQENAIF